MRPDDLTTAQLAGQLVVAGFRGERMPADLTAALEAGLCAGVIAFRRNLPTVEAAHALCREVVRRCPIDLPPFLCVDQEGGRVVRLPPPVLTLPSMRVLGDLGDLDLTRRAAAVVASELAAVGFNVNFAPVLDVATNPKNPVIGDRAFSSDPDEVARFGRALVAGHREGGVMSCGKHFPGHGDTSKDSHVALPAVAASRQRLDRVELPPFRAACLQGIECLMTAHVVYEALDPGVPATLSHRISSSLLRREVGFRGVLFSDDLEMQAVAARQPIEQTAVGAVRAGCDALLVCSDLRLQEQARGALSRQIERAGSFRARCLEAVGRSLAARRIRPPAPVPAPDALASVVGTESALAVAREIAERTAS